MNSTSEDRGCSDLLNSEDRGRSDLFNNGINNGSQKLRSPSLLPLLASLFFYLLSISLLIPIFPDLIALSITQEGTDDEDEIEILTTERYGLLQVIKSVLDLFSLSVLGALR